jgi:ferritin-like metal-binding protein YciE
MSDDMAPGSEDTLNIIIPQGSNLTPGALSVSAVTEPLITLLHTAHAAEQEFLEAVRGHLETITCSGIRARISSHLVEMQWQIRLLEACLEFRGNGGVFSDVEVRRQAAETAKAGLLAIKRFKIALYKKIIAEARKQQAPEVLQACREILEQERGMAEWIEDNHSDLPSGKSQAIA